MKTYQDIIRNSINEINEKVINAYDVVYPTIAINREARNKWESFIGTLDVFVEKLNKEFINLYDRTIEVAGTTNPESALLKLVTQSLNEQVSVIDNNLKNGVLSISKY